MSERPSKSEILSRLAGAVADLDAAIAGRTDHDLTAPGTDGWSIKDHLVHLAIWAGGIAALLRFESRMEAMGLRDRDFSELELDQVNERIFGQLHALSIGDALALVQVAFQEVSESVAALSEDALDRPYQYFQPEAPSDNTTSPITDWIVGNTYEHIEEHLPSIREIGLKVERSTFRSAP